MQILEMAPSLTDAQRAELGKKMPSVGGPVIGNLGMDWHTSLPSFEKAKAHPKPTTSLPTSISHKAKLPVKKVGTIFLFCLFVYLTKHE